MVAMALPRCQIRRCHSLPRLERPEVRLREGGREACEASSSGVALIIPIQILLLSFQMKDSSQIALSI